MAGDELELGVAGADVAAVNASALWFHQDARGVGVAMGEALQRVHAAKTNDEAWLPMGRPTFNVTAAIADFRALVLAAMWAVDNASSSPPGVMTPAQVAKVLPPALAVAFAMGDKADVSVVGPRAGADFTEPTIRDAAYRLQIALVALAQRQAQDDTSSAPMLRAYTMGAQAPIPLAAQVPGEALGWPLAVAAIAAVGFSAAAYLGAQGIGVYERRLAREEDSRRLVNLSAIVTDMVYAHTEADRAAGKVTPLNAGEQSLLADLSTMIGGYTEATKAREKQPDGPGAAVAAAAGAVASVATIAVVAFVAYLFLKSSK